MLLSLSCWSPLAEEPLNPLVALASRTQTNYYLIRLLPHLLNMISVLRPNLALIRLLE